MSCQCGCGRLIHNLELYERPHYELHVEIIDEVRGTSFDEEPAFLQRARWWVMKKGETFGTPKCDSPAEAIKHIPVLSSIWRQGPWRRSRNWLDQ